MEIIKQLGRKSVISYLVNSLIIRIIKTEFNGM